MPQAAPTSWHLSPGALAMIAGMGRRPETELVRDLLSPSGNSRPCYIGAEVDALYGVFLESDVARQGDCGALGIPFPEDVLAALFGLPDGAFETADEKAARLRLAADLAAALAPLQVAA